MNFLFFLLPIIDVSIISFSSKVWPSLTILFVLWHLCKDQFIVPSLILQTIYFNLSETNYKLIAIILLLDLLGLFLTTRVASHIVSYGILSITYYLILNLLYGPNYTGFGVLLAILGLLWYSEYRGRLDNRFA